MAKRFYVVPKIVEGPGIKPKYVGSLGVAFAAMDYGLEDTFLVGAEVTPEQHTGLASELDVIAIPANLDQQIGLTALETVKSRLEGLHVPSDWVTTSHTYREVVRLTGKLFLYMQRFHGQQLAVFFSGAITLDTRVNQLTNAQRTAMTVAAESLGLSVASITGPMLLRQALKIIADQIPFFDLFGETF